ncbi:MAG: aminotransferase class IV [bacterium]|nr:aminotransferase class IV [bacterium]
MAFNIFSKNGVILPISEAVVPLSSIEYAYGFGVYETLRIKDGKPLFLLDHIYRLLVSAKIIGLEHSFSKDDIAVYIRDLVSRVDSQTYNIKILIIGAARIEDVALYILCSNPLFPDKRLYRDGVALITQEGERVYPHAKSLNMLESYMAYREARENDAYDALLIDRNGDIVEGTRTNFFTIKDNVIYTAPEEKILLGITRKKVLETALQNGYEVRSTNITLDTLKDYDGAFITSTSSKILPVKKINDFEFPSIPESITRLMGYFGVLLDSYSSQNEEGSITEDPFVDALSKER